MIVTDMVVDVTETIPIIQVEAPTEIHMRVMVRIHFEDHITVQVSKNLTFTRLLMF